MKKKRKSTKNGHKLLTEKRNGLIVNFLNFSRRGKSLEKTLATRLQGFETQFNYNTAYIDSQEFTRSIKQVPSLQLKTDKKRVSGVFIDTFDVEVNAPKRPSFKPQLVQTLDSFSSIFPDLIELSQLKNNCQSLSQEIHRTNRQIANLEQRIEEIEATIKYIKAALMEKENYEKSILMKIFT